MLLWVSVVDISFCFRNHSSAVLMERIVALAAAKIREG